MDIVSLVYGDAFPNCEAFGHESIEDVLKLVGFNSTDERKQIYFGNWLRDYSRICDPKIVRKPGAAKDITKHLSRQSLTDVLNVLAEVKFVDACTRLPRGNSTK